MTLQSRLRASIAKYPHAVIAAVAVLLAVSFALVETSGVLPLEGQATPMYGPLKDPSQTLKRPAPKKPSLKDARRAKRMDRSR